MNLPIRPYVILIALSLLACVGILGFVGFILVGVHSAYRRRRDWERSWRQVARRTGLVYESKTLEQLEQEAEPVSVGRELLRVGPPQMPPRMKGRLGGFEVVVDGLARTYADIDSGPGIERRFTRIVVSVENQGHYRFALRRRGFRSPSGQLDAPAVRIDEPGREDVGREFDARGHPESVVVSVLRARGVAERLVEMDSKLELRLEDETLRLVVSGWETRPDALESYLALAVEVASAIDRG